MPYLEVKADKSAGPLRRALRYAFYDWTREMPKSRRFLVWVGILLQGCAVYALWTRSLIWPLIWPKGWLLYLFVCLLYFPGYRLMNAMLTAEFFRKTQLEADQLAAQQIQQTLQPQKLDQLPGYRLEMFYKPLREVGGDYFDVIELPDSRTLIAVADVSGKGMPAALLAANIQALVRSITSTGANLVSLATQINRHLCAYTPADRFATAIFAVLSRENGDLTYVNAGHNPPILFGCGSATFLVSTGMPLGLMSDAEYESQTAAVPAGSKLLVFTDGLPDGIGGQLPEQRICKVLASEAKDNDAGPQSSHRSQIQRG